jgi:hypothetical protein
MSLLELLIIYVLFWLYMSDESGPYPTIFFALDIAHKRYFLIIPEGHHALRFFYFVISYQGKFRGDCPIFPPLKLIEKSIFSPDVLLFDFAGLSDKTQIRAYIQM